MFNTKNFWLTVYKKLLPKSSDIYGEFPNGDVIKTGFNFCTTLRTVLSQVIQALLYKRVTRT